MTQSRMKFFACFLVCLFFHQFSVAQFETKTIKKGSAIIDMGAASPTVANSLKPYGLIYMMLTDRDVPVYQVISQTKAKDGIDFSHNGKSYSGGTFIIPSEFFRASVTKMIKAWAAQGVLVDYAVEDFTLSNVLTYNFGPKWVMDRKNGSIAVGFLNAAGIPSSAFSFKDPSELAACDDIFVLPHADPSWEVHRNLFFWNRDYKGNIWAGCNAVSLLENIIKDTTISSVATRIQMNFLSNSGLLPFYDHQRATPPFDHINPTNNISQYIGITDNAQQNGAETVYLPKSGGGWNASTKIITYAPGHPDVPGLSPGPAVTNIYGRAFNDANRGYVAYQASHNINGVNSNSIAAQRIFLNFSFFSLREKAKASVSNSVSGVPTEMKAGTTYTGFDGTASGTGGPFKYQWLVSIGGSFSAANSATTSYTPDNTITQATTGVITCVATDACGRKSISSVPITILPGTPPLTSNTINKDVPGDCPVNSITFNVFDSNVDANAGSRTLTAVSGFSNGTATFTSSGSITYTSNPNFKGVDNGTYTISNGSASASGSIALTVGTASLAPSVTNDAISVAGDNVTVVNVLSNDKTNAAASDGSKLYIRSISSKPSKGNVYINTDGTVSYLSSKDTSVAKGTDTFKYLTCNDVNYCSEGTVTVTITQNTVSQVSGGGDYKPGIDVAAGSLTTLTLTAVADSYMATSTSSTVNFGSLTSVVINANFTTTGKTALFKFDLSSISTSTTISSAIFSVTVGADASLTALNNPFPATLYRINKSWTETGVTAIKYDGSSNWAAAAARSLGTDYLSNGGSVNQQLTSITSGTLSSGTVVGATATEIAQSWVTTPANNYGMMVMPFARATGNVDVSFQSRDGSSGKPTLTVVYPSTPGVTYSSTAIPTNRKPFAYADTASTKSNTSVTINALSNDANYYGTLTARNTTVTAVSTPANGTAVITSGNVVYTPNGSFVGTDTLTYTITDATNSQTATATIRINVSRVAPVVVRDNATTLSGTEVTINVGTNDSDPQGTMAAPVITTSPKNGTAIIDGNNIKYTPSKKFVGNDTLIYQRSNVSSSICVPVLSDTALVVITVTNQSPTAVNDTVVTYTCVPITINVRSNDTDPEGTVLTPSLVTNPSNGTVTLNASGSYVYTPNTSYSGTDQFTYRVKDGSADSLQSNTATVVITVSAASNPNVAPVALPNTDKTLINQEVNTDVLLNDSDPNKDQLTISISVSGLLQPTNGTITLLANKMIRYVPNKDFTGTDSYEYQITDSHPSCSGSSSLTAKALVTIKVTPLPIQIGGNIWDDADGSAAGTFNNIKNGSETGTNADGALYIYLVDNTNTIIDQTSVDAAGKYLLVNAPANTSDLRIILSSQSSLVEGDTLSVASLPGGFVKTSPSIKTFSTGTSSITNSDFGIGLLPVANNYTFTTQLNPGALVSIDATKITGTDEDGSVVSVHYTSFPTNISTIEIGGTSYTSSNWPSNGVTVSLNTSVKIFPSAGSVTSVLSFRVIDNAGSESVLPAATINVPFYVALAAGTISGSATFCGSGIPSTFTSTTDASGGRSAIAYQWQSSTVSNFASSVTDITGAITATYTPTAAITSTTYFRRKATTTEDGSLFSNILTVTINALPASPTGSSAVSAVAAAVTISATASGSTGNETVDWYAAPTGGSALVSGVSGSLTTNYTSPVINNTTAYFAVARNVTTGCVSAARRVVTATITGTLYPGVIGSDQAGCGTFTPTGLTSENDASGLSGITYQWQSSTTSATTGFSNISGATSATYSPPAISATTYYRRVATSGSSFNSNTVTITSNAIPAVPSGSTLNAGRTGAGTVQLSGTAVSGVTIDWYNTSTGSGLLLSGYTSYTTPSLTQSTTYYPLSRNISTGCISARVTAVATINSTLKGGTINSVTGSICGSGTPGALGSVSGASGGTGTYNYQWQSSTTSGSDGFTDITGATSATYTPGTAITATTYYRRAVSTATDAVVYSNSVVVTIIKLPAITVTPASASILLGGTGQTLTADGADTYTWTPVTGLSSSTQPIVVATPSATTSYTVTGKNSTTGCSGTAVVTITVTSGNNGFTAGTIAKDQVICSGSTPAAFTSTTTASGGTGTITYQWQRSIDNSNFVDIPGATATTYSAPALSQTTYYRRAAKTSTDPVLYTASVTVTTVAPPVITGGISGLCAVSKDSLRTYSVTAAPGATSYVWTLPNGWTGTSTTNSITAKVGTQGGTISVTPYNGSCAGNAVNFTAYVIDFVKVDISGLPVTALGNNNSAITVTIKLYDANGVAIPCSGGLATLSVCNTSGGTFSAVVDNNNGTYTSSLTAYANSVNVCGTIGGVPIQKTLTLTFTGPQGGIKGNGPILATETPRLTFTMTEGRSPFTVVYKSAKSSKNDTLTNYISGTVTNVAQIPSTTLYTLVSITDANGEKRVNNFNRDTATIVVLVPKVVITLKADPAKQEKDSSWATRIVVNTKNIGDLDLSNSQARLNLREVFPSPVTYVLDSVHVSGNTVVPNRNYDGVNSLDLFAKRNNTRKSIYRLQNADTDLSDTYDITATGVSPDGSARIEYLRIPESSQTGTEEQEITVIDDGHSIYLFGPLSTLPVNVSADIILWLHVKPNGYAEPFVMQAVALGTGRTEGGTALATSLSNDNTDVNAHPEVTKQGEPLPTVINLFPSAVIGVSLAAGTPVAQGNGTYNVTLSYKVKNYGNLNLSNLKLFQNLGRMIGSPATFTVVSPVVTTGTLLPNSGFNAKTDSNMLAPNSALGYKQEATLQFTININPNQLNAVYQLQATLSAFTSELNTTITDLSTDGLDPDPDGNAQPIEKIITEILINKVLPTFAPGTIGIKTGPATTVLAKSYCGSAVGVEIIPTSPNTGGLDPYQYQWQRSANNTNFTDIAGAEDSTYTTVPAAASYYLRRGTISGSRIKYGNSVYIQIYALPAKPVITGTATQIVGKGNITLSSSPANAYTWSTNAVTKDILVTDPGTYTVTVTDANGCSAVSDDFIIAALDPVKVADITKTLSKAPTVQEDGSFLLTFNIVAANQRAELLDTVKIKDDLSKVFPASIPFSVVDIKASGKLIANGGYDGKAQIDLLNDVSKLEGLKTDSVQITIKLFPNGFAGTLNNVATLTARSPYGLFSVSSNDPIANGNPSIRLATKFDIPIIDIFIPSGFSPNKDGTNDLFAIAKPFNTTISLDIFNRWGNLVYKSADYKNTWDGKGNQLNRVMGDDLPDGTYYYVVLATDRSTGNVRKFAGFVTLKR
jgi:gliding motility-associated-like protein